MFSSHFWDPERTFGKFLPWTVHSPRQQPSSATSPCSLCIANRPGSWWPCAGHIFVSNLQLLTSAHNSVSLSNCHKKGQKAIHAFAFAKNQLLGWRPSETKFLSMFSSRFHLKVWPRGKFWTQTTGGGSFGDLWMWSTPTQAGPQDGADKSVFRHQKSCTRKEKRTSTKPSLLVADAKTLFRSLVSPSFSTFAKPNFNVCQTSSNALWTLCS